jgi:hypothetical protein
MKRTAVALGVAAATLWSAGVLAQGRNFAGTWTVDTERTALAAGVAARVSADGSGGGAGGRGAAGAGGAGGGGAVMRSGGGGVAAGGFAGGGGGGARGGGGGGGRGMAGPTTIALDASTFTVGTNAYKLDGSVTTTETPRGNITAKAGWKGDKLVIETTSPGPNGPLVSTATWYLEGEALVRETSMPAPDGGDPRVSKTYFKKS